MKYLLIIANSGRMLAQMARNAGLKPLVIDVFADLDMRSYAEDFLQVSSLHLEQLVTPVTYFQQRYAVRFMIYGSGFECFSESLHYLSRCFTVLGNSYATWLKIQNKRSFFTRLQELAIPYPETVFKAPCNDQAWLIKPLQGQGGIGIKHFHPTDNYTAEVYWQRYLEGSSLSVSFLADGHDLQLVGFNEQWTVQSSESEIFIFSGIINDTQLTNAQKNQLIEILRKLVPEFSLMGLNSLDFIQAGDSSWVLEINPRPSASVQLYDADLLTKHIQACAGKLNHESIEQRGVTAYSIVYAELPLMIPEGFNWSSACLDLPPSKTIIHQGQPICSIIAHKNDRQLVMAELQTHQSYLKRVLIS